MPRAEPVVPNVLSNMSTRRTRAEACLLFLLASAKNSLDAFQWKPLPSWPISHVATDSIHKQRRVVALLPSWSSQTTQIFSGKRDNASNKKRRRRKRKKTADSDVPPSSPSAAATVAAASSGGNAPATDAAVERKPVRATAKQLLAQEQAVFDEAFDLTEPDEDDRVAASSFEKASFSATVPSAKPLSELEDLFDSGEFLQRRRNKELEELSNTVKSSNAVPTRKRIKRSDIKAYEQLLEMDPTADEDDSYFEDEGIDFISALLGDVEPGIGNESDESSNMSGNKAQKKTSFLGIGSGPLQVGHFIGALGVILMAFVEYPGFPLTNLPDALRGALQEGLGTIYLINTVLAILSAISAPSRKQSSLLWGAKTFAVGAIAYDQLMQIPTPEELRDRARKEEDMIRRMQGRRGRR